MFSNHMYHFLTYYGSLLLVAKFTVRVIYMGLLVKVTWKRMRYPLGLNNSTVVTPKMVGS